MIVIGSKALLFRLEQTQEINERYARSDFDVIMTEQEFAKWVEYNMDNIKTLIPKSTNRFKAIVLVGGLRKQYEIEIGLEGTSSKFLLDNRQYVCDNTTIGALGEGMHTLNPVYLMLTKRSHLIYPIHFEKNIKDYHMLKNMVGNFEMDDRMKEYYNLRCNEAKNRNKQRTPKLNVSNEDFFSSKLPVPNYFVHDHIHEIMKHNDVPVYTLMQRDSTKAWCEKDMWDELSYDLQIQAVQEEAYVIALERYVIPQYGENWNDYKWCYERAVKRICTTLCSGWFRDFAIENYPTVMERYDDTYVDRFYQAYDNGLIVPKIKWSKH